VLLSSRAQQLADALKIAVEQSRAQRVALAVSGGRDSAVLLHLAARVLPRKGGCLLRVLHVDHGLAPERHRWSEQVRAWSSSYGISTRVLTVQGLTPRGESPEAWLRLQRYRLLGEALEQDEVLITAHHLDDQAETFLLQGLRGGGPAGLAAMPVSARLGPGWLLRPWLSFSRGEIAQVAGELGVAGFDDPANTDLAYDRSFLRHQLMPLVRTRWPSAARALGRSARWQAEAAMALDEAARVLLPGLLHKEGDEAWPRLAIPDLLAFAPPLRRVLIRSWLQQCGAAPAASRHVEAIERLIEGRRDGSGEVCWGGTRLRRFRDWLCLGLRDATLADEELEQGYEWLPTADLVLPQGCLTARLERTGPQRLALVDAPLTVGWRLGGERIRPAGDRHTRSLKSLLQQAGLPPWQRAKRPLLFREDALVAVPGLCVAADSAADEGEPGWRLEWRTNPAGMTR
jgi:tRNA(Ile)-lysidine synthase